jgi:hypothetical protein
MFPLANFVQGTFQSYFRVRLAFRTSNGKPSLVGSSESRVHLVFVSESEPLQPLTPNALVGRSTSYFRPKGSPVYLPHVRLRVLEMARAHRD